MEADCVTAAYSVLFAGCTLFSCLERLQRLIDENREQQEMLVQLVQRLDDVEATLQALQAERSRKNSSIWGGFIGPKGIL